MQGAHLLSAQQVKIDDDSKQEAGNNSCFLFFAIAEIFGHILSRLRRIGDADPKDDGRFLRKRMRKKDILYLSQRSNVFEVWIKNMSSL